MKRVGCIFALIFSSIIQTFCQNNGVKFIENLSWNQIKAKAKNEKKLIFVDVYATWCGPCKMMDAQIYSQENVGKVLNKNFLSIKVQQDQTNNDNQFVKSWYDDAKALMKKHQIETLPTYLFFSAEGRLVHRSNGYQDTSAFMLQAKKALKDPIKALKSQLTLYKKGKRDSVFLQNLANLAFDEGDFNSASIVSNTYIRMLANCLARDNIAFIMRFTKKSSDVGFEVLFNNREEVDKVIGANAAENKIMSLLHEEELAAYEKMSSPDWTAIRKKVVSKFGELGEERLWGVMTLHYLDKMDWPNFGHYYKLYFDRAIQNRRSFLHMNNMSWPIVEHVSDSAVLATAVKTMAYTIERFDSTNPYSIDTYANLLYKTGNQNDAILWEQKAVRFSNGNKEIQETLNKMKRGEKIW